MDAIASQLTSLTIVYSTLYSDADQRKHQSSASLACVRGIHRWPVNSPHKWPVTEKMFPFDGVIMNTVWPSVKGDRNDTFLFVGTIETHLHNNWFHSRVLTHVCVTTSRHCFFQWSFSVHLLYELSFGMLRVLRIDCHYVLLQFYPSLAYVCNVRLVRQYIC